VDASFHPQFAGAENFLKKVEALMRREFFVKVVCVAYPPQLGDLAPVAAGARGLGAHFRAQPFNGIYGGRAYPAAYSEEERETIRTLNENNDANDAYRGLDEDIRIQTEYFLHDRKVGGRLCWAGQKYIAIRADGAIQRCSSVPDDRLGNFYEGRFSFFEEPKACRMETCCCEWKWIADERDAYLARKNVPTAAKPGGFRVA
jgi:MoaA/NifB/PqqE/SkfB family radical SAM enzyme